MKAQRYILLAAMFLMNIATISAVKIITDPAQDLCPGDVITWRSKTITQGGDYADTLRTKLKPTQDSIIYRVHVNTLTPGTVEEEYQSVCSNELSKFTWHGKKFTKAGTYYYNEGDCDKVYVLHLTVPQPSKDTTITTYFCVVEGYNYPYGTVNRKDTTYIEKNKNSAGCDSIVTKVFKMLPYVSKFKMLQHGKDSSVTWMGKTYTQDGRYYDYYRGEGSNCDSVWEITVATRRDVFYSVVKCVGQVVKHNGKIIDHNCEVVDTLKTALGADSLLHFNYSFRSPFYHLDTAYICDQDTFVWSNHIDPATQEPFKFTTEGLYSDAHSLPGSECDSTYEIFVKVSNRWVRDSVVIICNDSLSKVGPIKWKDSHNIIHTFDKPNTDTIIVDVRPKTSTSTINELSDKHTGGCDSIFRFRVIITDRCSDLEQIPMCRCKGYVYVDGNKYTKPGIYSTKWPSSRGLNLDDSLHRFELYWEDNDTTTDEVTICESKLPLNYNDGKSYASKTSGNYIARFTNRHGCDSIVKLRINVVPTLYSPVNSYKDYCPGDEIHVKVGDTVFTKPGDFTYIVPYGTCGCDSVVRVRIETKQGKAPSYDTVYIRPGETYTWKGHKGDIKFSKPGTYYDSILNAYNCYEIYRLSVIEAKSYTIPETMMVCTKDSAIKWHNHYITKDTVLYDSLKTIYGMDSVYILTAKLYPAYTVHKTHTICYGDYVEIEGQRYSKSTTVSINKRTVCGCDSLVIHQINVLSETKHKRDTIYCAEGQTITWRGKTYNTTGDYADTLRSKVDPTHLCDSMMFHLHLEVIRPFTQKDSTTLCKGFEPFDWRGQRISKAGTYTDTVSTKIKGVNSYYILKVDTLPTFFTSSTVQICKGSTYNFDGELIDKPGTYVHNDHKAQNGCDSTVRCIVNFAPDYHFYDQVITYTNDNELPLTWPGHTKKLTGEGYFYDSLKTKCCDCDSIHRVQVIKTQSYLFSESRSVCDCQLPFTWHGITILKGDTTYTKKYTTTHGLDSVYQLTVKVNPTDSIILRTQLCVGAIYDFHGKKLTEPGVYRDTFKNQFFCDSIIILNITRPKTEETIVKHNLCDGGSISIGGKTITESGIYYETVRSQGGCDSTLRHIIEFTKPFYQTESKSINQGETYIWHKDGQPWPLTEAGTYFDSCKTVLLSCDSIYCLVLTVEQEHIFPVEKVIACQSELPYVWHNKSFYRDTTCQAKYKTKSGLDSIYSLDLKVIRMRDTIIHYSACDGEDITIDGVRCDSSTTFTKIYKGSYGCDSVRVKYVIKFFPRYSLTQIKELRQGEEYHFGQGTPLDTVIRTSGIYYRHFKTIHGCDSMVTLIVTACPTRKDTTITINLCDGDSYKVAGKVYTSDADVTRMEKTKEGCDSLVFIKIRFDKPASNTQSVSICPGGSYRWVNRIGHRNDTVLSYPGTYVDSVATGHGCFETSTLILNYKTSNVKDTVISMCRDKLPYEVPFLHDGKKYWEDSVFVQRLGVNIYGCDSSLRWNYQINDHCSSYDTYYRCSNEPKYIQGLIITKEGTYSVPRITSHGEDSIYRFIVRDVQPYETYTTHTPACDSTTFNGKTYYTRGVGNETFVQDFKYKSSEGCDSIEHRTFTIGTSSPKHITYATIADYEKYRFENRDYNVPGTYPVQHFNRHGCDSIEELQLTVLKTQYPDPVSYSFCAGDRTGLEIFGKLYFPTNDTIISDTIREAGQPVVRTAIVNKKLPFVITKFDAMDDQIICAANKVGFEITYSVSDKGALPEYYEVDFMVGDLDIEPKHAVYPVNGKTVLPIEMDGKGTSVNPGYYSYRIKLGSDVCAYSDTTFTGTVLVRYPAEIMKANWSNVITLVDANYNAGHWTLQAPYAWQVKNNVGEDKTALVVSQNNAQPYIASDNLREGDEVIATLYRKDYYRPIPSCPFIFHPVQANNYQHPVLIYPTVSAKSSAIHVETDQQGDYQLYNATGHRCMTGTLNEGDNMVRLPAADGCYLLKVTMLDGTEQLERVIVH